MAATISSTATRITISGTYKAFTSTVGSTTTVIQYSAGDAPAAGDSARFLMWKNDLADTGTWEIRYIESATATTVTVGDGGFSSAPLTGESFVISTNLADIETAEPVACTSSGSSYLFNGRDFELASNAFLGDCNKSLVTESTQTGAGFIATYPVADSCALQFGRLIGGEANDSVETIGGCNLIFEVANDTLIFTNQGTANLVGPVLNFYGCLVESFDNTFRPFVRSSGPMRLVGCIVDGPMGGRLYSTYSELVDTRFSGNLNGGIAWSLGGVFTRPINNAFFFQNNTAIKAHQSFTGVFSNTTFADSNTNIIDSGGAQAGLLFTFIDCTTFLDAKITNTKGQYKQGKSINYFLSDTSGTGLTGAKVAVYDNASAIQTGIQTSASGVTPQVDAIFFDRPHGSTSTDKSPFDINIRKYDYQFQAFQSTVSDPINQEYRLPNNAVTVLSEAAAGALTGIVIDFGLSTVTLTSDHTLSEIYDYCQARLALNVNMDKIEFMTSLDGNTFTLASGWSLVLSSSASITTTSGKTLSGDIIVDNTSSNIGTLNVSGTIDFSLAGTYTLTGPTINEVTNSSGGAVILNVSNDTTIVTNTGPSITINLPAITYTLAIPNIVNGSRFQIYNVTQATELTNSLSSGGISEVYIKDTDYTAGDVGRYRITYQSGVTAKEDLTGEFVFGSITATNSLPINQIDDAIYIAYGLDGSASTRFTADYVNNEIDVTIVANFSGAELYSWWVYNTTTVQGIQEYFGGVTAVDLANVRFNNSVVSIMLDKTTSSNVYQTDNIRLYREDLVYPVKNPTSGGGAIDIVWRNQVYVIETDTSGLTSAESLKLLAIPTDPILTTDVRLDNLDATISSRTTPAQVATAFTDYDSPTKAELDIAQASIEADIAAIPSTDISSLETKAQADARQVILVAEHDATQVDIAAIPDSVYDDTALIAKVDTVDSNVDAIKAKTDTLVNTDLTGIALSTEIAALNDFDPATDTVANVTLVATTTTNTDMRGTDSANTIAPDNASITAILADTNELQSNQGNFTTATGFATPTDVTDSEAIIVAAIASGALTAQDVWDYLQSETTVSASMKEAMQIALKNSKLIPAAL